MWSWCTLCRTVAHSDQLQFKQATYITFLIHIGKANEWTASRKYIHMYCNSIHGFCFYFLTCDIVREVMV